VSFREREGLVMRIRQLRHAKAAGESTQVPTASSEQSELRGLEARVAHLEQLLQGLQDSVHRESSRQDKRIADLETSVQPAAISRALSRDARERGL